MKKCNCPIYCKFCGARLKKDNVGHYCPTDNCQWEYGVNNCVIEEEEDMEKYIGYCVRCKAKKDMLEVGIVKAKNGRRMAKGKCQKCQTKMCKFLKKEK